MYYLIIIHARIILAIVSTHYTDEQDIARDAATAMLIGSPAFTAIGNHNNNCTTKKIVDVHFMMTVEQAHEHAQTHTHTHIYAHTHIYTHTHTHTHTYTHTMHTRNTHRPDPVQGYQPKFGQRHGPDRKVWDL